MAYVWVPVPLNGEADGKGRGDGEGECCRVFVFLFRRGAFRVSVPYDPKKDRDSGLTLAHLECEKFCLSSWGPGRLVCLGDERYEWLPWEYPGSK